MKGQETEEAGSGQGVMSKTNEVEVSAGQVELEWQFCATHLVSTGFRWGSGVLIILLLFLSLLEVFFRKACWREDCRPPVWPAREGQTEDEIVSCVMTETLDLLQEMVSETVSKSGWVGML